MFGFVDALRRAQGAALEGLGFGPTECSYHNLASGPHWSLRDCGGSEVGRCLLLVAAPDKRTYIYPPLLYTGDEIGAEFEPYDEGPVLSWLDAHGLREHYIRLVALRREHAVLRSERLEILETSHPESVLAYMRPGEQREDDVIVLLNYDPKSVRAALPAGGFKGHDVDLLSGAAIPIASDVPAIDLPAWGARVLRRGTADAAR